MTERFRQIWTRVYRIAVMPDYVMGYANMPAPVLLDEPVGVQYTKPARGESNS